MSKTVRNQKPVPMILVPMIHYRHVPMILEDSSFSIPLICALDVHDGLLFYFVAISWGRFCQ